MALGGKREGAGRKAGVPNKATHEVRDLARMHGPAAIEAAARLAGLILKVAPNKEGDGEMEVPDGVAESEAARVAALQIILDRAYGKATQPLSGADGEGPIEIKWLGK